MSEQYPGGYLTKSPVVPTTTAAPGIWNLSQQAAYKSAGIWPGIGIPDAQFNYVTMLLHGDGTNGAQNNTFLDSSTNNFTITRNGSTTQGSFSPYGSNWSNYFDGTGDYLSAPANSGLDLGTGDFTIECWFQYDTTPPSGSGYDYLWGIGANATTGLGLYIQGGVPKVWNGSALLTTTGSISGSTWYHIAAVRSSGTLTVYLNGTSIGSVALSSNLSGGGSSGFNIARWANAPDPQEFFGYVSNLRIVKGTAVYTTSFTPSTNPLSAISGTSLLTCQSNRFIDSSASNLAITVSGNPSVQRLNPFGSASAYATSTIGGSGYFNGTTDYLSVANSTSLQLRSSQFTIEGWFYTPIGATDANYPISQVAGGSESSINWFVRTTSGNKLRLVLMVATTPTVIDSTASIQINAWNYFAITCDGTGTSNVRMWLNGVYQGVAVFDISTLNNNSAATVVGSWVGAGTYMNGYLTDIRVIKGTALYTGTGNITVPTSPLTSVTNTQLLANMTNGAIYDNSMLNNLYSLGNAQISTSVKKYGTGSLAFDGTGDSLQYPFTPLIPNGTESFTIECWINVSVLKNYNYIFCAGYPIQIYIASDGTIGTAFNDTENSSTYFGVMTSSVAITTGTWYHVAIVRNVSSFVLYIDGVSRGSATSSNSILLSTTYKPTVANALESAATYCFNGYIDDFRITKGYARYTSNFTPPTAAFPNFGPT